MIPYRRRTADRVVQALIRIAQEEALAGGGHPDLVPWHRARLAAAKERLVLRLMGEPEQASKITMPRQPDVDYDAAYD